MKLKSLFLALSMATLAITPGLRATIVDDINGTLSPIGNTWYATQVAFKYVPGSSFDLYGVQTNFGYVDGRSVTLHVYDGSAGGSLLASTSFVATAGWTGGSFAPISLTGGSTYYIGFLGVGGLGANVTSDSGFEVTPYNWGVGDYANSYTGYGALLRFEGAPSSVPDSSSTIALLFGSVGLMVVARKFRK